MHLSNSSMLLDTSVQCLQTEVQLTSPVSGSSNGAAPSYYGS